MSSGGEREGLPVRFVKAVKALGTVPRVIITTSHRPGRRTRTFIKDLAGSIEGAARLTRGHLSLESLARLAGDYGVTSLVVIGERKGNPGLMIGYTMEGGSLREVSRLKIVGVSLSKELRLRTRASCKFVTPAPGSQAAVEVASHLSRMFGLRLTESPAADYLEVKDEGTIAVIPRVYPDGRPAPPIFRLEPFGGIRREP